MTNTTNALKIKKSTTEKYAQPRRLSTEKKTKEL